MPHRKRTGSVSRRTLLRGAGATIALPALVGLQSRAEAASDVAAKQVPSRMLVAHFGTGMNLREFFPDDQGPDCELKRITRPLDRHRDAMTILSGLQLEHGGGHTGDYSFLTGAPGWTSSGIVGGVSADQVVAKSVGQETRFPSMQLSIERGTNFGNQGLATLSWSENAIPLAAENDPHALFNRLFEIDDAQAMASAENRFRRRGSILDLVRQQSQSLQRRIAKMDKDKLDEYFTSVREIESQLQRDMDWSKRPKPKPGLANLGDYSQSLTPDAEGFDYARYQKLMYDLLVLAFESDSTRVITYNVRQELRGGVFPTHGVSKGFHALTHHNNDPKNLDELTRVDEINMRFWAEMLDRMASVKQADGRSLLEHCTIAFSSSAGMDHSRDRLPTILFGGQALGIQHRTHHKMPDKTPLANLWHTMAQAMGVRAELLQDSTGVIQELLPS